MTDDDRDYGDMLASLDTAIDEAERKIEKGRVRDAEKERVRIQWIRCWPIPSIFDDR